MRQFRFLLLWALCVVIATGGISLMGANLATTLDASFHYSDTNITEVRDIELFPDGRIAYGGGGGANFRPTAGILWPDGRSEWEENNSGNSLSETRSVAVDAEDGALFIGGTPRYSYDWGVQRTAFGFDLDWTLKANLYGAATKVLVLPNRDVLAAGMFRVAGDTNDYGLVRLNLEGTRDAEFVYTNTLGLKIENALVLADGSVIASWLRTNSDLVSSEAGRWLRTGKRDWAFNGGWAESFGTNSQVTAMEKAPGTNGFVAAVQTEPVGAGGPKFTKLLVFDEAGNAVGFLPGDSASYFEGAVYAIAFEAVNAETVAKGGYDRILVGGEFTNVGETPAKNLASLEKDGAVAWAFETDAGPSGPIYAVEVQLDGRVLLGGAFTNVNGMEARGMARIHGSGAEGATYLYWGNAEYRGFERLGEMKLNLVRDGNVEEALTVGLARSLNAANDVTIPDIAEFAAGQRVAAVPVGIQNDFFPEARERFRVTAIVTNETILVTRERTTIVVLDDETPGTLDPTLDLPRMLGLTGIAVQPDAKMLFHGYGRNIVRLNADGTVDPDFMTNGLPNGGGAPNILQVVPLPDGKLYVAGEYSTTNLPYGKHNLARLNADGSLDPSFDPRISQPSSGNRVKVHVLEGGDVLAWLGGMFGSSPRREGLFMEGIFRMNGKGQLVGIYSSSRPFQGAGEWALTATEELFTYSERHVDQSQIRKYKPNGAIDTNFVASFPIMKGRVDELQVIGDLLWVGGDFREVNTVAISNLARLNITTGALDTNGTIEVNGRVNVIQEDGGKVYIGGAFTKVNGVERFRVARLNLDGSLDMSFDPGNGPNRPIGLIEFQVDGKPIIGTGFDQVDGVPTSWYVRLEGDRNGGEIRLVSNRIEVSETNGWAVIEVDRVGGSSGEIQAMLYTVEGSALAGQQFSSTNVTVIYGDGEIGRKGYRVPIFADPAETGTKTFSVVLKAFNSVSETTVLLKDLEAPLLRATAFFSGGTNAVRDMAVGGDGVVYVAGNFTSINGKAMTNLARLHADLTLDTSFVLEALPKSPAGDPTMQTNVPIRSMAVRPNGMVAFSGDFTEIAGNNWISTAQVRPDGTYDEAFTSNNAATAGVMMEARHLALQPDEKIIATTPDELRRLNADGTKDTTFAFMRMPEGRKTVVHRDGGIYLLRVGSISRIDARNQSLVTIATVTYRATTSGSGSSSRTHALCIDRDGSLLVGGEFTHVNGVFSPRIARISTNGVVDTNFVANVGQTVGSAGRDMVTAIEVLANGDILVGGNFKQVEGEDKSLLALLRPDGTMRNEFDFGAEGSGIAEFERTPDGGVVVRGSVTAVDGNPAGDLFKLGFRLPLAPVVEFLWPTNGALVGVSDVEDEIRVHAFDPDGVIERAVLELDGVTVGTNSSGNIPFRLFLSGSGEHMLRLTVTDEREMTTSETITFRTVGQELAVTREGDEVVTHYYGAGLQESTDMAEWRNVHSGGGEYRTTAVGERRFFRSMQ